MRKERSWRKDALGHWQFHRGVTSRREIIQSWFNWRPTQFNLGLSLGIAPSGFSVELAFWFHWRFMILFFVPSRSRDEAYDGDLDIE